MKRDSESFTETILRVRTALDCIEPLSLTAPAAREAALIEAEVFDDGDPVNLGDTLVAGVCRHTGASLLTRDGHFEPVRDLGVERY